MAGQVVTVKGYVRILVALDFWSMRQMLDFSLQAGEFQGHPATWKSGPKSVS